eukprot:7862490-Heterocapsa_arctica.AAC.1
MMCSLAVVPSGGRKQVCITVWPRVSAAIPVEPKQPRLAGCGLRVARAHPVGTLRLRRRRRVSPKLRAHTYGPILI